MAAEVKDFLKELKIQPTEVQQDAIKNGLLEGDSILVCSPTGSGKTLIGEMALYQAVTEGKLGIYLVPLRALAVQVAEGLRERFEDKGIRIGESHGDYQLSGDELSEYQIIVTTYERADSLLRHQAAWLSDIGTLVIDEIQNLSDERRGPRLESVIMRLRDMIENLQIVALSATVGEPEKLQEWLGCKLVESFERPVPLRYGIIHKHQKDNAVLELVMTTVQRNGQVIVFHRTRREAEVESTRLAECVGRHLTPLEQSGLTGQMNSIEHWGVKIPPDLRKVMHEGVAYHHAGLGGRTRRLIESLFDKGQLRVICATPTLASGMNLPARIVILTTVRSPANYRLMLSANRVHQMLGRAGRPKRDSKGIGVILAESKGESDEIRQKYFIEHKDLDKKELEPKYECVTSCLNSSNALTEQLLVALDYYGEATLEHIQLEYFGESYLHYCSTHRNKDEKYPVRVIELGEITAATALECHGLYSHIRSARDHALGEASIRELSEYVIGGMASGMGEDRSSKTCRFSIRQDDAYGIEGPQCSCGKPIGANGILCEHLISLGYEAVRTHESAANYIIPLALSEASPSGTLILMKLAEGAQDGKLKLTPLGRAVNRLYLSIPTIRHLLMVLPVLDTNEGLMELLESLLSIESGQKLPDSFQYMLGIVLTTETPLSEIAKEVQVHVGDIYGIFERAKWIAYSIATVARVGKLVQMEGLATTIIQRIEARLSPEEGDVYDD
jgi:replicative superfamily II helicase